jgi:hypothetical protein
MELGFAFPLTSSVFSPKSSLYARPNCPSSVVFKHDLTFTFRFSLFTFLLDYLGFAHIIPFQF